MPGLHAPKLSKVAAGLAACVLGPATAALACAVCGAGADESRSAFIWTTGLLSGIPLISIGGIVGLLYKRTRDQEDAAD